MTEQDVLAHLVASRLAGRVATRTSNSLRNAERLIEGDPDCTMGLSDWQDAGYDEVLAAVRALGGRELDPGAAEHADGGYIEPEAALEGILRHRRALAEFVKAGGGRVLVATGHPSLLRHYAAVARSMEAAGCHMVRPLEGVEGSMIGYVEGVAVLTYDGREHHTHRSLYMEAMLDAIGGRDGVDLVVADHGYAGAAIEAGIETLSIADINDPALPLAQARGRTTGVLLVDDGLEASLFVPVTEAMLAGVRPRRRQAQWTPRREEHPMDDVEIVRRIGELADEEHRLERSHDGGALSDEELTRLRGLEVALDQCWDLLRQRRARRNAGRDPDEAEVRPADVVEGYRQ